MLEKLRKRLLAFIESDKDVPLLAGFICGLYPFLFFYSNNYTSASSWKHAGFFFLLYVGSSVVITFLTYKLFGLHQKLRPYRKHLLFVLPVIIMCSQLSYGMFFTFKKKILLGILLLLLLLSLKLSQHYKRLLVLIIVMSLMPLFRVTVHLYEDIRPMHWTKQPDDIVNVKLRHRPDIYIIQPDGYAGKETMEKPPYSYNNDFFDWLEGNGFEIYDSFRSNYPASLASNASMFAMKHHYFDAVLFPSEEVPNAREVILNNDVLRILKNNGYETFLLAQDEYFQQNKRRGIYDHYNIKKEDVPFIVPHPQLTRDVSADLEKVPGTDKEKPKFVFIERVLPHHVPLYGDEGKIAKRDLYIEKVQLANTWLKETIDTIEAKSKDAVIIILADHGGWVGIDSYNEMYSTKDKSLIYSTFGNLAAIRWSGLDHKRYDGNLKSNVNLFRVLFSCLAENTSYLNHLEKNESYNIRLGDTFDDVYKLIDENGNIVREKH